MFFQIKTRSLTLLLLLLFSFQINSGASTNIRNINSQNAIIHMPLKTGNNSNCFSITTVPNTNCLEHISLISGNGTISTLKPLSKGWMGNKFLQWYSFDSNLKNIDTAKIELSFNSPILKTTNQILVSDPIISLPLIATPKPAIKRSAIPSHKFTEGIRIEVSEDGIYKIKGEELKSIGVPTSSINATQYKLYCQNQEIPIFISGSDDNRLDKEDNLYFYGKFLRGSNSYYTSYSYSNVYWLTWEGLNPGLRFAEVSGGSEKDPDDYNSLSINPADPFLDTIHLEEDNDIRWLGDLFEVSETSISPASDDTIDNWYWGFAGDKELTHFTFTLPAPYLETSSLCELRVSLAGLSNLNDLDPDHNFSIHLNDNPTGINAVWDGQNEIIVSSKEIPIERLRTGQNTITFIKNHADSIPDRMAVNWFEFIYKRSFTSQNNSILFKTTSNAFNKLTSYKVTNFTNNNIDLWDIANHRKFKNIKIAESSKKYTISFYDSLASSASFIALSNEAYKVPIKMKKDSINTLLFATAPDYIIISTDSLLNVMTPLIHYYTEKGLTVSAFDIQDIYNTFSYGIHNPESIRDAVKYLYSKNPNNPPQYLLLGGDASHDMDKQREYMNVIPTHLSRTPNWGPSADDGYFVKVNGDDNFMDLSVGRFPAENSDDMKIMVDKTLNYLQYPEYDLWRDNMILAGGFEENFTKFNNEAVSSIIDNRFNIHRMDAYPKSDYYIGGSSASDMMAGYINSGVYFINFIGHGGGNVWSDSKFFSYSDLEKLHNSRWSKGGRLPIIFSFTCLTGFFESVFYKSLGEEFLRNSSDGAISFYGAAGYTRRNIDISMSRTLLKNGLSNSFSTLGELINTTEIMMLAQNESEALPLINQYNLLGDPALPWKPSKELTNVSLDKKQHFGSDTLKIAGTTNFTTNGEVSIKVISDNDIWDEKILNVTNGTFTQNFILKNSASTANGLIRTFAWSDSSSEIGFETFSKDAFALYDLNLSPQIPIAGDSVNIECRIDIPDTSSDPTIQCLYTIGDPAEEFYNFDNNSYVFLSKNSVSNTWKSISPIIVPKDSISNFESPHLILQFKSTGSLGISPYYSFKIKGLPDLELPNNQSRITMIGDSLRLIYTLINSGTEKAYSPVTLFTGNTDTLFADTIKDTINIGETVICTTKINDLNGLYSITGSVNPNKVIEESDFTNNIVTFNFKLSVKDLLVPFDTLKSFGSGLMITPLKNLSAQRRIFLFYDTLNSVGPLISNSKFEKSANDGFMAFRVFSRPALSATDSLKLTFTTVIDSILDSTYTSSVFSQNPTDSVWSFEFEDQDTFSNRITIYSQSNRFLAPAHYTDNTGPQIRAYVNSKEVIYIDYIAKGMPFNIIITDTSGVDPSSINISLNGTELTNDQISTTSKNENLTSINITAYPPTIHDIDTLSVIASDLAGNQSQRNFIYRPGKNLEIKFFSCHPNPFAARKGDVIRFAYLLTDAATSVEMTIYTIAGRKVWKWKNDRQLTGYQEIKWDGTTENDRINGNGYRLANGTYYAKLVVKNNKRKVEKIIRIAKLEGY